MSKIKAVIIIAAIILALGLIGEQDRKTEMLEAGYSLEQIK